MKFLLNIFITMNRMDLVELPSWWTVAVNSEA